MNIPRLCLPAAAVVLLGQCTPYQQQSAMIGGIAGGAIGALVGDDGDDVLRGAAAGAAAGTAAAAIHEDSARRRGSAPGSYGNPPPTGGTPGQAPPSASDYPVARRTDNPNYVIIPYEPYNVIDVSGFRSGDLARDPGTGKIFRVP
jgi:hypothetical protein